MKKIFCSSLAVFAVGLSGCAHFEAAEPNSPATGWDQVPEIL
jgi:hypothetical protein